MPDFAHLPDIPAIRTLKAKPHWVAWRVHTRTKLDGTVHATKVPIDPHGTGNASVSDPATWGSYDEAVAHALAHGLGGVGYVLVADDDVFGVDLDGVRDPATGALLDFAGEVIKLGETYTEVSPSGRGLRQFCLGKPGGALKHHAARVEVYEAGRYLTVTGDRVAGTADAIAEAPQTLALLQARVDRFKAAEPKKKKPAKNKKQQPKAGIDFFRAVNEAALAGLEKWVPGLFPDARFQPGTGAWRVTSHELGRNLEEDLSLHPLGVTDWGLDDQGATPQGGGGRYTAIDILISHGGAPDAKAAAFWLCEHLGVTPESLGWSGVPPVIADLNETHAVLPIGSSGKTRVATFGDDERFPGRTIITMAQTFEDFAALKNKYRHKWIDEDGEEVSIGLGSYWLSSEHRRQYDKGQAFMPQHDGDANGRLNLWRGFGVQAIKPDGRSGAAGCAKFLDFALKVICSGNAEHFDYLIKREALILQKRIRSEVALGLRSEEEGAGKGVYENAMRKMLGRHAMHITKPEHLIGKFNEHLGVLLRVSADEALFVGDPKQRNGLFTLITEPELTIEPKFIGAHNVPNYLNISMLSNAAHFIPVGPTARRFFGPTVSAARVKDFAYFDALHAELTDGGYEALLYHLLHEVDLQGFKVQAVPQTDELRRQRDLGLPPLESWWVALLEDGVLWGSDPKHPNMAVSNAFERRSYGEMRPSRQKGLYDQAREIDARLRLHHSEHRLGGFLSEKGCTSERVLRRRGWRFPSLLECREKWEAAYPSWTWRDPDVTEWRPEEERADLSDVRSIWIDGVVLSLLEQHPVKARLDEAPAQLARLAKCRGSILPEEMAAALQRLLASGRIRVDRAGMLEIVLESAAA